MKRTTSMKEITFDLNTNNAEATPSDPLNPFNNYPEQAAGHFGSVCGPQIQASGGGVAASVTAAADGGGNGLEGLDQRLLATVSPRVNRRHSADFLETPHFLRSCGLCRRRLVPGRDIYMYRYLFPSNYILISSFFGAGSDLPGFCDGAWVRPTGGGVSHDAPPTPWLD